MTKNPEKVDTSVPTRLTDEQVRHVAKLSRLALTDEQVHRFAEQLSVVLDHISKLKELDVEGVEPMAHALDMVNVLREDTPLGTTVSSNKFSGIPVDTALANAPEKSPPFFKVPKVLGEGSGV